MKLPSFPTKGHPEKNKAPGYSFNLRACFAFSTPKKHICNNLLELDRFNIQRYIWVFPKIGGCFPQNGWCISWKTLWTNGCFGVFPIFLVKHPYTKIAMSIEANKNLLEWKEGSFQTFFDANGTHGTLRFSTPANFWWLECYQWFTMKQTVLFYCPSQLAHEIMLQWKMDFHFKTFNS